MFEQTWLPEIVFFALGIISTLILSRLLRPTKTLDRELLADEPIVSAGSEYMGSSLSVQWEGSKLEHPRVISLRIFNSGKREVLRGDLQDGIRVAVPGVPIVAAYVTDATDGAYPKGPLTVQEIAGPEQEDLIQLTPEFLNEGDYIAMQVIVDGDEGRPEVGARFAGQSRRRMRNVVVAQSLNRRAMWTIIVAVLAIIAAFATLLTGPAEIVVQPPITELPFLRRILFLAFMLTAALTWIASIYYQMRFMKRQQGTWRATWRTFFASRSWRQRHMGRIPSISPYRPEPAKGGLIKIESIST